MVMEELALIDESRRQGPLIINHKTGLPYFYETFRDAWHDDLEAGELPDGMWCRDMRAGGVTEGGKSGASARSPATPRRSKPRNTTETSSRRFGGP
jgi:hypothetical protein